VLANGFVEGGDCLLHISNKVLSLAKSTRQLPKHTNFKTVRLFVSMVIQGNIRALSQLCERMLCMSTTARPMEPDV
jgi:hypothetical protein